jgi:hypothetical protein
MLRVVNHGPRIEVFVDGVFPDGALRLESSTDGKHNRRVRVGNSGYSACAQLPSGELVVVDYTASHPPRPLPILRSYHLAPARFAR